MHDETVVGDSETTVVGFSETDVVGYGVGLSEPSPCGVTVYVTVTGTLVWIVTGTDVLTDLHEV